MFPSSRNLDTQEKGYIYVMRSAAHAKDIFKIGLSRRSSEIRSAELSRTTGVPDQFLIVQEWEVSDCVKAEKLIHHALLKYRMKPEREFFKAPYKVIVKVIGEVIVEVEGTPNHIDNKGI
ncbi:GIY-YIG nuclease family protein [Chloroflexota bacterium]